MSCLTGSPECGAPVPHRQPHRHDGGQLLSCVAIRTRGQPPPVLKGNRDVDPDVRPSRPNRFDLRRKGRVSATLIVVYLVGGDWTRLFSDAVGPRGGFTTSDDPVGLMRLVSHNERRTVLAELRRAVPRTDGRRPRGREPLSISQSVWPLCSRRAVSGVVPRKLPVLTLPRPPNAMTRCWQPSVQAFGTSPGGLVDRGGPPWLSAFPEAASRVPSRAHATRAATGAATACASHRRATTVTFAACRPATPS